jgi:hypothetical protein
MHFSTHQRSIYTGVRASLCTHCDGMSIWLDGVLVKPAVSTVEPPHPDLPADVRELYEEAMAVGARSPRAAAALLRLALQRLTPHLGEPGKNINEDIKSLVAKGLPVMVQQALDVCRVVGNSAVHPLEINLDESPETAMVLFQMINLIVEDRISRPKDVAAAFNALPEGARAAIARRDGTTQPSRQEG